MSCDWNVHCLDCNETHEFNDANHRLHMMQVICRHAGALAELAAVVDDDDPSIEITTPWGRIDVAWFAKHRGHGMVPIDEYGRKDGQCRQWAGDSWCSQHDGHAGEHDRGNAER